MNRRKKQTIVTAVLGLNIFFFFQSWFGGVRGVQEVRGTIVLFHPLTLLALALILLGIWMRQRKNRNKILCISGASGLVVMELFCFCTWYTQGSSQNWSLTKSFSMVFMEFYFGFALAVLLLGACIALHAGDTAEESKNE